MENLEQQPSNLFELQFDENAKSSVLTITRWAMVMVISSTLGYVLSIVKYFREKSKMNSFLEGDDASTYSNVSTIQTTGLISMIVSVGIGLLITYFLYQFASKAKSGMETMSSYDVNIGFANFKNYFLTIGILAIIAIVFGVIGFISMMTMMP